MRGPREGNSGQTPKRDGVNYKATASEGAPGAPGTHINLTSLAPRPNSLSYPSSSRRRCPPQRALPYPIPDTRYMQTTCRRLATSTTPSRSASLTHHSPSPVSSRLPRSSSSTSIASAHSSTTQTPTATATATRPGRTMSTVSIAAASRSPSVLPVPVGGMSNLLSSRVVSRIASVRRQRPSG